MKHKNILIIAAAMLMTAPAFSATSDNDDKGATQTLTVNEETVERTVSEIRVDGNNVVLLFTDGTTQTADMRLVMLTMSYEEVTEVKEVNENSWYTLDGIKVTVMPKQKGVYIQNGKKVVNK